MSNTDVARLGGGLADTRVATVMARESNIVLEGMLSSEGDKERNREPQTETETETETATATKTERGSETQRRRVQRHTDACRVDCVNS